MSEPPLNSRVEWPAMSEHIGRWSVALAALCEPNGNLA